MNEKIKELRFNSVTAKDYFLKKLAYTIGPIELKQLMESDKIKIVDVRTHADYVINHIPTAISIPKEELDNNLQQLSKEEITVVYSYNQQCHLGAEACLILTDYNYPVVLLEGGFKTWMDDFRFAVSGEQQQ